MAENPVNVEVVEEQVPAQVAPPREPDADKVEVHETSVTLDRVITDPTSEEAVQVPDEGKGSLDLPIHRIVNATTPEDKIESADGPSEVSDEERAKAAAEGRSVGQVVPSESSDSAPAAPKPRQTSSDDE